ncbi:MAG: hypothetical protein HC910_02845 [Spirulinaceae cyanobacterium SM2_1_0]|nr:hypothetical protein [Spirulinaceae cyanobacterium SM2_1_0]
MSRSPFDFDQWHSEYLQASSRQAHQLILTLLEQPLSVDWVEEMDLGMILVEMRDELASSNDFPAFLHFLDVIRDRHPEIYAAEYPYFDTFLVDYYLYRDEPEHLRQALSNFRHNPAIGVEPLFEVCEILCLYGANEIASELCRATYEPIRKSSDVIRGAEDELSRVPLYVSLETAYCQQQSGETVDWQALEAELQPLGLSGKPQVLADLRRDLTAPLPRPDELSVEFQNDLAQFLRRLAMAACCHLATHKQMSFLTTRALWDALVEFLERRDVPPSKLRSPEAFFTFSEDELDRYLHQLVNAILSERSTTAVGLLWGIPYLYDFLHGIGVIATSTHQQVIAMTTNLKGVLSAFFAQSLWRFDFVHRWQPPDSIELATFQAEAARFRDTFEHTYPLSDEPAAERQERQLNDWAASLDLPTSERSPATARAAAQSPPVIPDPPPPAPYKVPKQKKSPLKLAAELGTKKKKRR